MKFVILALALVGLVFSHPHCSIQTDKQYFDLSDLQQLDFSFADDNQEGTTTFFNLCGPVGSIPDCADKNVAVCVQTPPNTYVSKGYESMKSLSSDNDKLVLSYNGDLCDGSTQYATDFVLVCAQTKDLMSVDSMESVDKCHRVITLTSPSFCPTVPHHKSKILFPFITLTAIAACCCACLCCACRRRFRRARCNQQGQQSACQKKCFFQRLCRRSCDNKGYQPVSTQTELNNAVPMDSMVGENVYPPTFMYPPMFPMYNGQQQLPFAPIPMDAKTFQEQNDEAYARQLQQQINQDSV